MQHLSNNLLKTESFLSLSDIKQKKQTEGKKEKHLLQLISAHMDSTQLPNLQKMRHVTDVLVDERSAVIDKDLRNARSLVVQKLL